MANNSEITEEILRERHFTSVFADGDMRLYIKVVGNRISNVWIRFDDGKYIVGIIPLMDLYYAVATVTDLDARIKQIEGS